MFGVPPSAARRHKSIFGGLSRVVDEENSSGRGDRGEAARDVERDDFSVHSQSMSSAHPDEEAPSALLGLHQRSYGTIASPVPAIRLVDIFHRLRVPQASEGKWRKPSAVLPQAQRALHR